MNRGQRDLQNDADDEALDDFDAVLVLEPEARRRLLPPRARSLPSRRLSRNARRHRDDAEAGAAAFRRADQPVAHRRIPQRFQRRAGGMEEGAGIVAAHARWARPAETATEEGARRRIRSESPTAGRGEFPMRKLGLIGGVRSALFRAAVRWRSWCCCCLRACRSPSTSTCPTCPRRPCAARPAT